MFQVEIVSRLALISRVDFWLLFYISIASSLSVVAGIFFFSKLFLQKIYIKRGEIKIAKVIEKITWGVIVFLLLNIINYIVFRWTDDLSHKLTAYHKIINTLYIVVIGYIIFTILPLLSQKLFKFRLTNIPKARKNRLDSLFQIFIKAFLLLLLVSAVLNVWGIELGRMIAGLGIGSLAVALAAKSILANLLGGLSLMLDKSFEIGDQIKFEDKVGIVEELGWRSTKLRSFDDELVSVPNAKLVESSFVNVSKIQKRRIVHKYHLANQQSAQSLKVLCTEWKEAILERELTDTDKGVTACINSMDSLSYELLLIFYIKTADYSSYLEEKEASILIADELMSKNSIKKMDSIALNSIS